MVFSAQLILKEIVITARQACVYVLNLRDLDMLFALCPFYFCLTKTGMRRMHRLSHTHSEVSIADMTKRIEGGIRRRQQVMKGNKNTVCSRSPECIVVSLHARRHRMTDCQVTKQTNTFTDTRCNCVGAKEQLRCWEKMGATGRSKGHLTFKKNKTEHLKPSGRDTEAVSTLHMTTLRAILQYSTISAIYWGCVLTHSSGWPLNRSSVWQHQYGSSWHVRAAW